MAACLYRCTWSSGWCRLITFRLRFDSHRGSFASNLEQAANLLCAQVNSAFYPQRDGKWVVAYGLRGEGLVCLIGAVVCLLAANCGSNCLLTSAMDGRIVRCGIISSCKSAATSEIVKCFWSRTHVRSAITIIGPYFLPLPVYVWCTWWGTLLLMWTAAYYVSTRWQLLLLLLSSSSSLLLGGIALAVQSIPPIATHFSVAWSVCLSSVTLVHPA